MDLLRSICSSRGRWVCRITSLGAKIQRVFFNKRELILHAKRLRIVEKKSLFVHQTRRRLRDKESLLWSLRDQGGLVLSDLTLGNHLALKGPRDLAGLPDAYHRAEHDVFVALSFLGILINQLERLLNVALFLEVSLVIESQP